jgi:hypothetical protein
MFLLVESRSVYDQNTSWVITGYPGGKIDSNKEFSQLLNSVSVPERFRKESCSVRNKDKETMGVVEQVNEKEKEQLDTLEVLHV